MEKSFDEWARGASATRAGSRSRLPMCFIPIPSHARIAVATWCGDPTTSRKRFVTGWRPTHNTPRRSSSTTARVLRLPSSTACSTPTRWPRRWPRTSIVCGRSLLSSAMTETLQGRSALVTGAGRGIGKGVALELARAGCRVAVNYVTEPEKALETVDEIRQLGGKAIEVEADVSVAPAVSAMIDRVIRELG